MYHPCMEVGCRDPAIFCPCMDIVSLTDPTANSTVKVYSLLMYFPM